MIYVNNLQKHFKVAQQRRGPWAGVRNLVAR